MVGPSKPPGLPLLTYRFLHQTGVTSLANSRGGRAWHGAQTWLTLTSLTLSTNSLSIRSMEPTGVAARSRSLFLTLVVEILPRGSSQSKLETRPCHEFFRRVPSPRLEIAAEQRPAGRTDRHRTRWLDEEPSCDADSPRLDIKMCENRLDRF